jgi:uncharacterized low-complexity protein
MSTTNNKILRGILVAGAMITGAAVQAAPGLTFSNLGSGAELRTQLSSSTSPVSAITEHNCAAKAAEAKCGESKCGDKKDTKKKKKKAKAKKQAKSGEAKCGEGKCG